MDIPISEIESYFDRLFSLPRSISGEGYQKSLDIIREIIPLEKHDFHTGNHCFDWTIPDEWNVREAYIIDPDGHKIADFGTHNLHLVGYSEPVDAIITLEELRSHLHTLEQLPDAIPYVTSYYRRTWGFCIPFNQYKLLRRGLYRVYIDSDLKPGKITVGVLTIPGKMEDEILISTYLCHPSLAVNELSGPLVAAFLYRKLCSLGLLNHTVRFVFCPENIGAVAFLSRFGDHLLKHLKAGFVVTCVGHGGKYTYKRSREGNTLADRAALNVLKHQQYPFEVVDFFPDGSDERQYCSPGFNLPVGLIMRTMYGTFKEYHTSLDNKDLLSFLAIKETIDLYCEVVQTIDRNKTYLGRVQKGTPQLSKSPVPLYRTTMDGSKFKRKNTETRMALEILNRADGHHDLLSVAEVGNFKMLDMLDIVDRLIQAGYIRKDHL